VLKLGDGNADEKFYRLNLEDNYQNSELSARLSVSFAADLRPIEDMDGMNARGGIRYESLEDYQKRLGRYNRQSKDYLKLPWKPVRHEASFRLVHFLSGPFVDPDLAYAELSEKEQHTLAGDRKYENEQEASDRSGDWKNWLRGVRHKRSGRLWHYNNKNSQGDVEVEDVDDEEAQPPSPQPPQPPQPPQQPQQPQPDTEFDDDSDDDSDEFLNSFKPKQANRDSDDGGPPTPPEEGEEEEGEEGGALADAFRRHRSRGRKPMDTDSTNSYATSLHMKLFGYDGRSRTPDRVREEVAALVRTATAAGFSNLLMLCDVTDWNLMHKLRNSRR
jgi:hypothetical protein